MISSDQEFLASDRNTGAGRMELTSQGSSGRGVSSPNQASGEGPMVFRVGDKATGMERRLVGEEEDWNHERLAQSEQYLSNSPKGRGKKNEESRSPGNTGDWDTEELIGKYKETNYTTSWQEVDGDLPRRTEHKPGKNKHNRGKREERRNETSERRTLLIENMMNFKSYDQMEDIACEHGRADQIKQIIQGKDKVKCYIAYKTYQDAMSALDQEVSIKEKLGGQVAIRMVNEIERMKVFAGREPYIVNKQQKEIEKIRNRREELKKETIPKYFWAKFKPNIRKRFLEANKWLYKKIGQPNWKKFNSGILIETETDQSCIIKQFTPEIIDNSPFAVIEPHNKFNTTWCEIFSWDLEDHTEQDLLDVCPEEVINVVRPWGDKPVFFLEYNKTEITNVKDIKIENLNIPLKLKKTQPMICKKCLNYGHTERWCKSPFRRCRYCADTEHITDSSECMGVKCLHCGENHITASKKCPRYINELNLLEKMNLLKIDRREARRMINEQSYASATKDSTKKNYIVNENRETFMLRNTETINSGRQTQYDRMKQGKGNIHPNPREAKLPEEQNRKNVTKRGTSCDRAAMNLTDGRVRKGRLRTSTAVAEAYNVPTRKQHIENDQSKDQRSDENTPMALTNQYGVLSEPSNLSDEEPEEMEIEKEQTTPGQDNDKAGDETPNKETEYKTNQKPKSRRRTETGFKCQQCKTVYKSEQCKAIHEQCAHNNQNQWQDSAIYNCEYREREHRCSEDGNQSACIVLYQYKTKSGENLYIDSREVKYNNIKSFRLGISNQKNLLTKNDIASLGGKRIFCPTCRNYEFSSETCLQVHKEFYHNQLEYKDGARPFDHRCYLKERSCINVVELIDNDGIKTYADENEIQYKSIEEYRTQPPKKQTELKRKKRQLDSTTPPSQDGNKKKNKQDDDHNSTFSEGAETHSVSELRGFFENHLEDPLPANTEQNLKDLDKSKSSDKMDDSKEQTESQEHRDDIYLSQVPENTSYITEDETDSVRTQNVIEPEGQKEKSLED